MAMSPDELRKIADAAASRVLTASLEDASESGWSHSETKKGIRIERNKRSSPHEWRAFGTIDAPFEDVVTAASLVDRRPEWDPMCSEGSTIQLVEDWEGPKSTKPHYSCCRWVFKGVMLIVSPREMVSALTVQSPEPGTWVTACSSMEHPDCPARSDVVRGVTNFAGLVLKRNTNNGADITYVANVDPKGWLPAWAVNLGAGKGALCIDFLNKYVSTGERGDYKAS